MTSFPFCKDIDMRFLACAGSTMAFISHEPLAEPSAGARAPN